MKNKNIFNPVEIRLLFTHILLILVQTRETIKDCISNDLVKKVLATYQTKVLDDISRLRDLILPDDKYFGSIDISQIDENKDKSL